MKWVYGVWQENVEPNLPHVLHSLWGTYELAAHDRDLRNGKYDHDCYVMTMEVWYE